MFAVDENIGGAVDRAAQTANNSGRLVFILLILFVGAVLLFAVIMYLMRRKFLRKPDRKTKFIRLP